MRFCHGFWNNKCYIYDQNDSREGNTNAEVYTPMFYRLHKKI